MLKIEPGQMIAFEKDARDRFVHRTRAFVSQQLQTEVVEDRVRWAIGEGSRHGLRSEQDLVKFSTIALLSQQVRDPGAGAWITATMRGPGSPEARLARLEHAASARWAGLP